MYLVLRMRTTQSLTFEEWYIISSNKLDNLIKILINICKSKLVIFLVWLVKSERERERASILQNIIQVYEV